MSQVNTGMPYVPPTATATPSPALLECEQRTEFFFVWAWVTMLLMSDHCAYDGVAHLHPAEVYRRDAPQERRRHSLRGREGARRSSRRSSIRRRRRGVTSLSLTCACAQPWEGL